MDHDHHLCQTRSPGTPEPAGHRLSRRTFLVRALGTAAAVYGAPRLTGALLDDGVARAASVAAGAQDRVLVSVFLPGGLDGLSLLAPTGDGRYRARRRTLALPEDAGRAFAEDPRLRWHPSAAAIADLHAEGKVTVLPAIGYDHPDQSHFTSRHFWEVGALDTGLRTGWMGRLLDATGSPDNPLQGLALSGRLAPALASARVPVAALDSPQDFSFGARGVWGDVAAGMVDSIAALGGAHAASGDAALRAAGTVAAQAIQLRGQLAGLPSASDGATYPGGKEARFPRRLRAIADMLAAGLPLRCVAVEGAGQYDTHDDQAGAFAEDVGLTADSLLAFQRDLEARGLADRVLVHVWSEFGRRVEENGARGTDHGAAGLSLLIGTRASGRQVGEFPGLDKLDGDGNVRATSDFRALYASLSESWLGVDAGAVLPGAANLRRYEVVR